MRKLYIALGVVVMLVLIRLSYYTVDASEFVYVTVLGRPTAVQDGGSGDAGLQSGWPWPFQQVQRLDRRLQYFDLPATELLTPDRDKKAIDKTLSVEAYVCWKIASRDTVERFIQSVGKSKVVEYRTAGDLEAQKIEIEAKKQADLRLDKAAADEERLMRLAE